MKIFINRKTIKNIVKSILIITILSMLVPVLVQAKTDTEDGGGFVHPVEDFILFLGDKVMEWLQNTFVSMDSIEVEEGIFEFKYSPAIIFSGTVPAFDINFIDQEGHKIEKNHDSYVEETVKSNLKSAIDKQNTDQTNFNTAENNYYNNVNGDYRKVEIKVKLDKNNNIRVGSDYINGGETSNERTFYAIYWIEDEYIKIECEYHVNNPNYNPVGYGAAQGAQKEELIYYYTISKNIIEETNIKEYKSTASLLQSTIATWYNVLRRIALVGLLSVIVYVGIRIVMSSAAGEKAKYKEMLKDWIVAICILFTLHYIMNITITVTNEISDIFQTGESDELLKTLREEIFSENDRSITLAKTIMYVVLVILTVMFTVQYLKRVIYMAFYTLIAPLITLTYPLDKIKDGQAQAFNMWIREYVYTALIQIIHLVIYYVLVGSALDLVSDYPLYAIIALLFIKKADGIIKKMFGFDKSETVGTLGAAATGALVVNALSQLSRKRWRKKRRCISRNK